MGEKELTAMADDLASEGFQCSDHPYQSNPGGICAFCLQDRLGKLLTSSSSTPFFPPPSSPTHSATAAAVIRPISTATVRRRTKLSFFKTKKALTGSGGYSPHHSTSSRIAVASSSTTTSSSSSSSTSALRRSKSATTRRQLGGLAETAADTPRKRSFWSWSFLRRSDPKPQPIGSENLSPLPLPPPAAAAPESPGGARSSSFGRKVSRSRSVGCGSRSFSGDFLERISTGFGDCALRRVESQREGAACGGGDEDRRRMKERVKCGGIFAGFGMLTSSTHWITAAATGGDSDGNLRRSAARGRSRS